MISKHVMRIKLCISLLFLITGCTKNNPIEFKDFQSLRCESNTKEKKYSIYIFNKNNGYLYFYDEIKDEFIPKNERFESGLFSENSTEIFSTIHKNNLLINNIEYYNDLNKNQKYIKKQEIINLKSLIKRTIYKNKKDRNITSKEICIWIDPKLGIK